MTKDYRRIAVLIQSVATQSAGAAIRDLIASSAYRHLKTMAAAAAWLGSAEMEFAVSQPVVDQPEAAKDQNPTAADINLPWQIDASNAVALSVSRALQSPATAATYRALQDFPARVYLYPTAPAEIDAYLSRMLLYLFEP
jgi:hypothetical protein